MTAVVLMQILRRGLLVGLLLTAFGSSASVHAQNASLPFDPAAAPSEQLRYNGASAQVVGLSSGTSLTIAWQSYDAGQPTSTKLTRFTRSGASYARTWEKQLPLPRLAGMTSDGTNFYVLSAVAEDLRSETASTTYRPNVLFMTKFDGQGNQLWQRDLNTADYLGDATDGVASTAIFSPLTAGTGVLAYGNGKVVVALATNTLPDTSINQRHQRAQYFIVGEDGSGFKAAEETSWRHSFDQRLLFDGQDFVFMDLGDAGWYMPGAGVALRKIKPTPNGADFIGQRQGVYIYARQAETAGSQNFSFTSLGDLQLGASGYVALFSSEKSNPTVMRDGWQQPVTEPRNLGLVHVTQGFDQVMDGEWNSPDKTLGNTIIEAQSPTWINITSSVVDSAGPSATFTRADKPEKKFTQTGIVWLTNLAAGLSAERPKLIRIADGRYIAAWEEWSYSGTDLAYVATKAMLVNDQGQVIRSEAPINARLNPSGADRTFVVDGNAAWVSSNAGTLTLYSVDANLTLSTTALGVSGNPQPPNPAPTPTISDHLNAGGTLTAEQKLQSADGRYTLLYQVDGNLVLYNLNSAPVWSSNTSGKPVGRVVMQDDGNLVIYGPNNEFIWNSGTTSPGSSLLLQNDGNLVIYDVNAAAVWATSSLQTPGGVPQAPEPVVPLSNHLDAGGVLRAGEKIQSANARYSLLYQLDGNLVIYDQTASGIWSSNTNGTTSGRALMQDDGNFVIYGPNDEFLWNTGTTSPGSNLLLQDDGNLVIYSATGAALWASNTAR
jgi:hypothetical protein